MSATASRTSQGTVELRQLLLAIGVLIVAVALLVAVGVSRQAAVEPASPAAVTSPADHDRGWMSTSGGSANAFDKAHAPKSNRNTPFILKTNKGSLVYTGIPYYPDPAPAPRGTGGSNGTRFAQ